MTGSVPYYGGRFTPAQAYAAAHPPRPSAAQPPNQPPNQSSPTTQHPTQPGARPAGDPVEALQHLLDSGVLTQKEFDQLLERVVR